jgi:HPr kinase/phosphorylase
MRRPTVHASAVAIGGRGVLIRGASGSGKSSLVLQMLTAGDHGSALVADDRVDLRAEGGRLMAAVPHLLAGLLEVRGHGILRLPYVSPVAVALVVDLRPSADCPRMPEPDELCVELCGVRVARIFIASGAPDGSARVRAALHWPLFEKAEISAA